MYSQGNGWTYAMIFFSLHLIDCYSIIFISNVGLSMIWFIVQIRVISNVSGDNGTMNISVVISNQTSLNTLELYKKDILL